jgi:hypothetical protein
MGQFKILPVEDESQLLCFCANHDIMESIEVAFGKTLKQNFILVTKLNKTRRGFGAKAVSSEEGFCDLMVSILLKDLRIIIL